MIFDDVFGKDKSTYKIVPAPLITAVFEEFISDLSTTIEQLPAIVIAVAVPERILDCKTEEAVAIVLPCTMAAVFKAEQSIVELSLKNVAVVPEDVSGLAIRL